MSYTTVSYTRLVTYTNIVAMLFNLVVLYAVINSIEYYRLP